MDRLHQSASTRFPSRIRIVTTAISIFFNLALTDSAPQKKLFLGSDKVIQTIQSSKKLLSLQRTLADNIFFPFSDTTITKKQSKI